MTRTYNSYVTVQTLENATIIKDSKKDEIEDNIRKKFEFDYSKYYFGSPLRWTNIIFIIVINILAVFSFIKYDYFKSTHHMYLAIYAYAVGFICGIGITAGAHRLWCHRAYKAKLPLRIILMVCFCMAGQNSLYDWVRDHRIHHKYSETDADPHNSKRGFFFAHIGWLMVKKHYKVIEKGRQLDLSDLLEDPVVKFQEKYFIPLKILLCFVIPTVIPFYLWDVEWYWIVNSQIFARYTVSLHMTFLVNSAAHMWGNRPYDKRIRPVENFFVAFMSSGEGWHNYHHTFPWDYRASEMGKYNPTTKFLDLCGKLGLAYDMKAPSPKLIRQIAEKYGDGSWGDKEISEKEAQLLINNQQ